MVALPLFFQNYRALLFRTTPLDAYHQLVQYWAGDAPDTQLVDPTAYRIAFPLAAVPFYLYAPRIPLSREPTTLDFRDPPAMQAIATVNYFGIVATLWLSYLLIARYTNVSVGSRYLTAGVVLYFLHYLSLPGIDPCTIAYLLLLLYLPKRSPLWSILMLLSPLLNEKIALLFVGISIYRVIRHSLFWSSRVLWSSVAALLIFFLIRHFFPLPGFPHMSTLSSYPGSFVRSFEYLFNFKGAYLNLLPVVLLSILYRLCDSARLLNKHTYHSHRASLLLLYGLFVLGMCMDTQFTIGRLSLHALPFFVVPIARLLNRAFFPTSTIPYR